MMKYFSIKNKDLTGILTNFKNSELAIKLNEALLGGKIASFEENKTDRHNIYICYRGNVRLITEPET